MKPLAPFIAFASIAAIGLPTTALAQSAALAPAELLLHLSTSFDLVVHAPFGEAAKLFGPEGERAWAGKHWNPQFIHPETPADVEGAVFTVRHGSLNAVWVTSLADLDARHFQYVYFIPDLMVTVIDVRFKNIGADSTGVNVVYTRTAIASEGNEHVKAMNEVDKSSGKEWQQAIDDYLAHAKTSP
jgi:hypothetical protein